MQLFPAAECKLTLRRLASFEFDCEEEDGGGVDDEGAANPSKPTCRARSRRHCVCLFFSVSSALFRRQLIPFCYKRESVFGDMCISAVESNICQSITKFHVNIKIEEERLRMNREKCCIFLKASYDLIICNCIRYAAKAKDN
jgi:hypothetical protein